MKEYELKFISIYIQEIFLTSLYFSIGLTKEHCTEIVKLNYLNQSATTFIRTMNETLPELKGIYKKRIYGIASE